MQLRDHPLMSYRGVCNWPPTWLRTGGGSSDIFQNKLHGEIGVLDQVFLSRVTPYTRCYLTIEFEGEPYMGTLIFEDATFCRQVFKLLENQIPKPIKEIGDLYVGHLL